MNKKFLFSATVLAFAIGSAACSGKITVGQGTSVNGNPVNPGDYNFAADQQGNLRVSPGTQAPVAGAALQGGPTTVPNPAAKTAANPAITVPNAPAVVGPTPTIMPVTGKAITLENFGTRIIDENPYEMIKRLDDEAAKEDHPKGGWTLTTKEGQTAVFWTGIYETGFDVTFGGKVDPYRVDGKTGIYLLLPNNTITVPSPGGSILLVNSTNELINIIRSNRTTRIDKEAVAGPNVTKATACVTSDKILKAINDHKTTDAGKIYQSLDELVNASPSARLRANNAANATAHAMKTLFWVQAGKLSVDVLEVNNHEGKTLYLALKDKDYFVPYPFSGIESCDPLDVTTLK